MTHNFTENQDYEYIYPETSQVFIDIRLISGEYSGTIFRYGKVGVEEDGSDHAYLKFEYDIISSPIDDKILREDNFKNYIGDLLVHIMSTGVSDEVGNDYTEEFDL